MDTKRKECDICGDLVGHYFILGVFVVCNECKNETEVDLLNDFFDEDVETVTFPRIKTT